MKTHEFETKVIEKAGKLDQGWRRRVGGMRGFHLTSQADFFWDGESVCRRMAIYEVTLHEYWFRMTVYQTNNQLEVKFLGIQPDETSEECLNKDYEQFLMVKALSETLLA